jgi:hypothetical protein
MHTLVRRYPLFAASLWPTLNRRRAAPWRTGLWATAIIVALVVSLIGACRYRLDTSHALPAWWMAGGFGLWSLLDTRRRWRQCTVRHQRSWMQAWSLTPGMWWRWRVVSSAGEAWMLAAWPAVLAGLALSASGVAQVGLNLVACALGAAAGVVVGGAYGPRQRAASSLIDPTVHAAPMPFIGEAQLRCWQRRAMGRLSLRRWAIWTVPLLLLFPPSIGLRAGVQLLLLMLVWPLHARTMVACRSTLADASCLLAATPMTVTSLWRWLLPRPLLHVAAAPVLAGLDLAWLGMSWRVAALAAAAVLLLEGGRLLRSCRRARAVMGGAGRPDAEGSQHD